MKDLRIFLLVLLLVLSTGCTGSDKRQDQLCQLNYDQAVEMVKHYTLAQGLYEKEEDIRFMYEPNNDFWNAYFSNAPKEALDEFGLTGRDYYAIILLHKRAGTRDGGATVFVDKDEKRIIGALYDGNWRFVENSQSDYDQAVKILKEHVLALGLYEQKENIRFIYEPNNGLWNLESSGSPKMLEKCGLTNRNYFAFVILSKVSGTGFSDATIFIDKDEKRVIGVLYDDERFVENTAK